MTFYAKHFAPLCFYLIDITQEEVINLSLRLILFKKYETVNLQQNSHPQASTSSQSRTNQAKPQTHLQSQSPASLVLHKDLWRPPTSPVTPAPSPGSLLPTTEDFRSLTTLSNVMIFRERRG